MIVRFGIDALGPLLAELGSARPLLLTSERFADVELPVADRFTGVRRHAPTKTVAEARAKAQHADGLVALGGGSAIDTGKAVAAATGLALVAVPTTYAGAEWTTFFGMRDAASRRKTGGSGEGATAVVYEPALTLDLPRAETVGTALNALAHAAEALYAGPLADAETGARLIGRSLPAVVANGHDLEARTQLLDGAMHAGRALRARGLFLAHAVAQALGGRYDLSHGVMNALCLAPALRFNAPAVPEALAALARALEADDAPARIEELAVLGGFGALAELGVPEDELRTVAQEAASRPGAVANPRPVTADDVEALLRSIYPAG